MHELSLASSILDAMVKEVDLHPGHHAVKVCVRIGEFAGVDCESLAFCFAAIVKDTLLEPVELKIEPGRGDDLDIAWIEMEEPLSGKEMAA